MSLVIDASVAVKWVLDEPGSDRANAIRGTNGLMAPSLIIAEVGNALWKAALRGVPAAEALTALRSVTRPFDLLVSLDELQERALALAIELQHPIYDCFYLALAERESCPFVSADSRLLALAKRLKRIETRKL